MDKNTTVELKAFKLVNQFMFKIEQEITFTSTATLKEAAKQCALIHCNEMIAYFDKEKLWNHAAYFENLKSAIEKH